MGAFVLLTLCPPVAVVATDAAAAPRNAPSTSAPARPTVTVPSPPATIPPNVVPSPTLTLQATSTPAGGGGGIEVPAGHVAVGPKRHAAASTRDDSIDTALVVALIGGGVVLLAGAGVAVARGRR